MSSRMVVLLPVLILAGCGEQAYLQYQGRPAASALECKAAYEEAKRRGSGVDFSSGAAVIGSAIGNGIASGMIESAYETCLARVSALPPSAVSPAPTVQATPGTRPQCSARGGAMQGGTGYCIGG